MLPGVRTLKQYGCVDHARYWRPAPDITIKLSNESGDIRFLLSIKLLSSSNPYVIHSDGSEMLNLSQNGQLFLKNRIVYAFPFPGRTGNRSPDA
jgi:hypothetical protein